MKGSMRYHSKTTPGPVTARASLLSTIVRLWPHMWPATRADLKRRVVMAFVLLVAAKLVTITVPFSFKWAVDALVAISEGRTPLTGALPAIFAVPAALVLVYGALRVSMALLTQLRDGLFAKVALHAVRRLALLTFEHMHALSLRFHLERKTGGLTRVLERGRNGIEELVRLVILQLTPTIFEFALVLGVLIYYFDWRYALAVVVTVVIYLAFTYRATELRSLHGALRGGVGRHLHVACRLERRSGGDLHARPDRGDDAGRARRERRRAHGRRFRHGQRHADPALHSAELHGHGLSRDQAGDHRHRDHVFDPGPESRGSGSTQRRCPARDRRRHPL
jgi:ABC-type multidrug transport system fused ATPase/permease subunit